MRFIKLKHWTKGTKTTEGIVKPQVLMIMNDLFKLHLSKIIEVNVFLT